MALAIEEDNLLDGIVQTYRDATDKWEPVFIFYATRFLWWFGVLEICIIGCRHVLKNADMESIIEESVIFVILFAFFSLLLQFGSDWFPDIIASFRMIGDEASRAGGGLTGISPSSIFDRGISIAHLIMEDLSINPSVTIGLALSALVILICFAMIAALMLEALITAYVVTFIGILMLGFGASRFTRDYALKAISYVMAAALQLMTLQLIVGVAEIFVADWHLDMKKGNDQTLVLLAASIVLLWLVMKLPDRVQSLFTGISFGGGEAVMGALTGIGSAAAALVTGSVGGFSAVKEASGLAGMSGSDLGSDGGGMGFDSGSPSTDGGPSGSSGGGSTESATSSGGMGSRFASTAGAYTKHAAKTAINMGKAFGNDFARRASGQPAYGNVMGRMAADMKSQRMAQSPDTPPSPPPGNSNNGDSISPG